MHPTGTSGLTWILDHFTIMYFFLRTSFCSMSGVLKLIYTDQLQFMRVWHVPSQVEAISGLQVSEVLELFQDLL